MAPYQRAYEAVARGTGLDERAFEFIEKVLTLDGLTQQIFTKLNTSDIGPTRHQIELRCAGSNDIYQNLDSFLGKSLAGYPVDEIKTEERPVYVTRSGKEISGTRKKVTFRLHPHQLDTAASKFQRGDSTVRYDEGMDATYAPRTFATVLVYNEINLDFVESQGDPVVKKKGDPDPRLPGKTRLLHD